MVVKNPLGCPSTASRREVTRSPRATSRFPSRLLGPNLISAGPRGPTAHHTEALLQAILQRLGAALAPDSRPAASLRTTPLLGEPARTTPMEALPLDSHIHFAARPPARRPELILAQAENEQIRKCARPTAMATTDLLRCPRSRGTNPTRVPAWSSIPGRAAAKAGDNLVGGALPITPSSTRSWPSSAALRAHPPIKTSPLQQSADRC